MKCFSLFLITSAIVISSCDKKNNTDKNVAPTDLVVNANLIADEETYMIKVYDQNGKCMLSKTIKHSYPNSIIKIQLPVSVTSGTYFLYVQGTERSITKPFIVER